MRQRPKPVKSKVPVAPKSPKNHSSRVRDLEKRLAESLEQQTATSEILRVISSSPTDVQPVFDIIARNAAILTGASVCNVFRFDGKQLFLVAHHNFSPEAVAFLQQRYPRAPSRDSAGGCAVLDCAVVHLADIEQRPEFAASFRLHDLLRFRGLLAVPLLNEGRPVGAITVARVAPGPFSDRHIALLETFADQAVIAIANVRLFTELQEKNQVITQAHAQVTESLEQQTATAEILRVISSSPTDLQPVLDAVAERAARLCSADDVKIHVVDGNTLRLAAQLGPIPANEARPITPTRPIGRAVLERRTIHVHDMQAALEEYPDAASVRAFGTRTSLATPLLREGVAIGVIQIRRLEVEPFSQKQLALLETFADQAVIAIENVRLFKELEVRNTQLTESLGQQTATGEILSVIARSPTDIQPVFDTVVESAARLCEANDVAIYRRDGDRLRFVAHHGSIPPPGPVGKYLRPLDRGSVNGRSVLEGRILHIADLQAETDEFPTGSGLARRLGFRTMLSVPLMRGGAAIGTIMVRRTEARLFSERQVALLQTFADQAVIAVENVRLFTELEEKNKALTQAHAQVSESLEQQTATSEILRVISGSPRDVQPVFETILANASRLCEATFAAVFLYDGEALAIAAHQNASPQFIDYFTRTRLFPSLDGPSRRAALQRRPVHVHDLLTDPTFKPLALHTTENARTVLSVPLLRENQLIGVVTIWRREARPFTSEQVALLKTFADQAVIAIENVRLFKELEGANRELSAASQHKSEFLANMSHELRTPLNAIIGFSEVLTERMFGELNEKQEEYLKDIYSSGTHLLSLINDILDLSKIEAGRMELELTDFHLPTALDNALMLVRERAGRRSITLQTSVDEQLGEVRADERKIRQVVLNLLSNAIKFTPDGGRIEVGALPRDGYVEVSVADTGVGIAPEDQEAVFEEFRQVGTAEKKAEGTGLGLTLCRKFIELHGGRIGVKSQLGAGSTFTFTIPVRRGE
jgi:two-component system NtrC family sensor kinase